jgi:ferredoxin-NADP reductase
MSNDQTFAITVDAIEQEAEGVVRLELVDPEGRDLPAWEPGAHFDLILDPTLARPYSLCGDPGRPDRWTVAVLREPQSRGGSRRIHSELRVGDRLAARGPRNNFALEPATEYLLVAGGIGITPLLPMVDELSRQGAPWRLLYGGRTRDSMAFLQRLEGHGDRVTILPEDETGLLPLAEWLGEPRPDCAVYCCGPTPLIDAVGESCADWPDGTLHIERFRAPVEAASEGAGFLVKAALSGVEVMVGEDESIVDALDRVGVEIPISCGEGVCETCLTKVVSGEPDHRDMALADAQREEGWILPCCSRAKSAEIVLDV